MVHVERVDVQERRVRVEHRHELLVEVRWKARAFEELEPAVDTYRCAAHVALLPRDLAGQRRARCEVGTDHHGVDTRAEVVDVRHGGEPHASVSQRVERPGAPKRREEISVPRCVQRGMPRGVAEQLPRGLEPKRHELVEDERVAEASLGDMRTDRCIRREAGHQRDGNRDAHGTLERLSLDELRLEKAHAVDRGEGGLDDAAEARRHPAGEHDLRDLPAPERIESRFAHRHVLGVAGCR